MASNRGLLARLKLVLVKGRSVKASDRGLLARHTLVLVWGRSVKRSSRSLSQHFSSGCSRTIRFRGQAVFRFYFMVS